MIQIDRYTLTARFLPAVIIAAPPGAAIHAWLPYTLTWSKGVAATAAVAALAYILSHATRCAGRRLEDKLWACWGGPPSTIMLRHSDTHIDPVTKARYHQGLVKLGALAAMPDPETERANPIAADNSYSAAITWLQGRTRHRKEYPLVFEQNVNYGFMRNLLACKPWALAVSLVSLATIVTAFWFGRMPVVEAMIAGGVALYLACAVTDRALRYIADAYAYNILEVVDHLSGTRPATSRKKVETQQKRRPRPER